MEHPVMAALRIREPAPASEQITTLEARESIQDAMDTDQVSTPSGIVVAVGAKESSDVYVAVLGEEEGGSDAVLNWHRLQCEGLGTLGW